MMQPPNEPIQHITDISETLLIPLYARAFETQFTHPLINDRKAVQITETLNKTFATSTHPLHQRLARGKIRRTTNKKLTVFLALRTKKFDGYCQEFLAAHPDGVIVELGCGLSTRLSRIDNTTVTWYDLDLPEVIAIRRHFFQQTPRSKMISSDVRDFHWMDQITPTNKPTLFLAEGLLMYLHEPEVRSLLLAMQKRFPGCDLVCEVVNTFVITILQKKRWKKKFQKDHHLGPEATMHFGITHGNDLESWGPGIRFRDEWTLFDDHEKKLGWMNLFAFSKRLRKAQWIVHYHL